MASALSFISCSLIDPSDEPDLYADITLNSDSALDISGELAGSGGHSNRVIRWSNAVSAASATVQFEEGTSGRVTLRITDAEGVVVYQETTDNTALAGAPETIAARTGNGTSGLWTVTIFLSLFEGGGNFEVSPVPLEGL